MDYNQLVNNNKKDKVSGITFDYKRLAGSMLGHWYWFLLSLLLALIGGFIYLQLSKPVYTIKSTLLVDNQEENTSSDILNKLEIVKKTPVNFYNELNTLHSEDLVLQAVDSLGLNIKYYAATKLREIELYTNSPIRVVFDSAGYNGSYTEFALKYVTDGHFDLKEGDRVSDILYDTWIKRPYGRFKIKYTYNPESEDKSYLLNEIKVAIRNKNSATQAVLSDYSVISPDGRTSVVDLIYKDNIPARGIDFVNTLVRIYLRNKATNIDLSAQKTRDFITSHKADLMKDLNAIDSSVETIKSQHNVVLDPEKQTINVTTEQTVVKKQLDELYTRKKALINLRNLLLNSNYQILVPLGLDDQILIGLINQYNELVQRLGTQEKVQELGSENPFLLQTIVELEALKRRILDVLRRITDDVDNGIVVTTKNETSYLQNAKNLSGVDKKINEVKRGYDVLQNMYLFLFQKGIENEISAYNETNKARLLVSPYAGSLPVSPIKNTVLTIALLLGLLIPTLLLLIKEILSRYIYNENDIKSLTTISIAGVISKVSNSEMRNDSLAINPGVRTSVAEQFRVLRANMDYIPFADGKKVITVMSSNMEEGKTFTALNLGVILALSTKRVIVVEFDLRRPRMAEILSLDSTVGVSDYLSGNTSVKNIIRASGIHSNLYVASCGRIPANPGDLLAYPSTSQLIQELSEMFDVVVLDTAPINLVSDALILSKFAGINLLVTRQAVTLKSDVRKFDELCKNEKIVNPAIIFNSVEYLKKYGYYSNPNKSYEAQLVQTSSSGNVLSFFKK
ncbi:MAG: polysaccharide biosynthesis tyrosine autokinase [Sphingobacteriales bacterium]|nr:MAG: polysaccharide biosynthesis tyrosine autokinase [Sphingobacteriales bacterium]